MSLKGNEHDVIETKYSIGPGIRHAIIWLSIISSFGAGWYTHSKVTKGELASAELSILKTDIVNKAENRELKLKAKENLEINRSKTYDKNCGDMSLRDYHK